MDFVGICHIIELYILNSRWLHIVKKKLQVFVSSTYEDLKEERQSAVQAILTSGHIPAGMELFSAGDESQKETIRRWIQESDVYLLILGGRYGSIDSSTGKSYTHWEYEYAGEIGKPRFAVVISDKALEEKIKTHGTSVMEIANMPLYQSFRKEVLSRLCKIYEDSRDIQLGIFHKMSEYSNNEELVGWVHGNEVPNVKELINENARLIGENTDLRQEIHVLQEQLEQSRIRKEKSMDFNGLTYEELKETLKKIKVELPQDKLYGDYAGNELSTFHSFISFKDRFATGITNDFGMNAHSKFLFFTVAPKLMTFGLVEKVKVSGAKYEKIQTSKLGFEFLKLNELDSLESQESSPETVTSKPVAKKSSTKKTLESKPSSRTKKKANG